MAAEAELLLLEVPSRPRLEARSVLREAAERERRPPRGGCRSAFAALARAAAGPATRERLPRAIPNVSPSDKPLSESRGVALYDTRKDENFTSLDAFEPAVESLASDPRFAERFWKRRGQKGGFSNLTTT